MSSLIKISSNYQFDRNKNVHTGEVEMTYPEDSGDVMKKNHINYEVNVDVIYILENFKPYQERNKKKDFFSFKLQIDEV